MVYTVKTPLAVSAALPVAFLTLPAPTTVAQLARLSAHRRLQTSQTAAPPLHWPKYDALVKTWKNATCMLPVSCLVIHVLGHPNISKSSSIVCYTHVHPVSFEETKKFISLNSLFPLTSPAL